MKRNFMKLKVIVLLLTFNLPFTFAMADELTQNDHTAYVSSLRAKLLVEPNFDANTILYLKKGDKLAVIDHMHPWFKVKTSEGKLGWLSKFLISTMPPFERVSLLKGDVTMEISDIRRRASGITTAATARGLSNAVLRDDPNNSPSNLEAVKYMESLNIDSESLEMFVSEIYKGH